jgi:periplasmic protein TonB
VIRNWRLVVCVLASIVGHFAAARGLQRLPARAHAPVKRLATVRLVAPPPVDPPPEPPVEAKPPPVPHERPRAAARSATPAAEPVRPVAPPEPLPAAGDSRTPVFGVSMESTSQAATGPSLPVGNSSRPEARDVGAAVPRPLPPVSAAEVTTMPLPQGRCAGEYTDEARRAAIEGTVVLDLVIGEDGRVREVHVVTGLSHGLTEAAIAAAKACRFSPGEKDGIPVPVRVRGFKIRFLLQNEE